MNYPWHLYAMAVMYVIAGIFHFVKPKIYMRIMPNYLPNHKSLVFLSGAAEIVLGLSLCFPSLKNMVDLWNYWHADYFFISAFLYAIR